MIEIIPAILPQTYREIQEGVDMVRELAPTIQIDFCDGKYVQNKSWWFNGKDIQKKDDIISEKEGLPFWDSINYEFDLMVEDPLSQIETFIALGPAKIIFHKKSVSTESLLSYFENLPEVTRQIISFGVAIELDDDPSEIAPLVPYLRRIQCMGIEHIGVQGQPFTSKATVMVKKLYDLYGDKVRISVDGGVNESDIPELIAAGATRLVVGSAIFQSVDPHGTIERLQASVSA